MALEEARSGPVLWLAVGPSCCSLETSALREAANVTCLHLPIATAADAKEALDRLLATVRSQQYGMVVFDCVPALAPPPPAAVAAARAAMRTRPRPSTAVAAPAAPGAIQRQGSRAAAPTAAAAAAAALASQAGAAPRTVGSAAAAASTAAVTAGPGAHLARGGISRAAGAPGAEPGGPHPAGWWEVPAAEATVSASASASGEAATASGPVLAAAGRGGAGPAAPSSRFPSPPQTVAAVGPSAAAHSCRAGGAGPWCSVGAAGHTANLKFLHNVLPVVLEGTLAELAASCGPALRTTTLLLNNYTRQGQGQDWLPDACGGGSGGGSGVDSDASRDRWARSAIVRHAAASLHVTPMAPAAGGGGGRCGSMHAVVTKGQPSGEDGSALYTGSLVLPVRLAEPKPRDPE